MVYLFVCFHLEVSMKSAIIDYCRESIRRRSILKTYLLIECITYFKSDYFSFKKTDEENVPIQLLLRVADFLTYSYSKSYVFLARTKINFNLQCSFNSVPT